jgi:O-antigen ligase
MRRPRRADDPMRLAVPGAVALVGLVFLLAAGVGAGVLMAGVAAAIVYVIRTIAEVARGERLLVAAQKAVVLALLFLLPVTMDPRTADVFAVVKFSILATGGVLLLGLLVADLVVRRDHRRPGLVHALVAFLVVWGIVTTFASGHARLSTLGFYSSNNGLVTLVALALVFAVTASVFRVDDVRATVALLWFSTTGVVVLYGVLQLLDQAWSGQGLEPVNWPAGVGVRVFGTTGVWATFGNPNHLGGYCAIALPLGIAMLFGARSRAERLTSAAIAVGAVVIIGQTSSRGAWVAAAAGIALMAIVQRRTIFGVLRRRPLVGAGAAAAVAASAAASLNSGLLSKGTSALFETGGATTIAQRVHFWRTTVRMASDEPLLGHGFDGYRLTFPHYASDRFIDIWGYDLAVTGPHNTFMAHLYWGGWPVLAAFVAVVVWGAMTAVRVVRRLRAGELTDVALPFTAVVVAALGYLFVESFNVERLELAVIFWFAVGLVTAVSSATAPEVAAEPAAAPARRARGRVRSTGDGWGLAAAVVLALVLLVWTSAPWRADNALRNAGVASSEAREVSTANPQLASARAQAARDGLDSAVATNRWEARYLRVRADQSRAVGQRLSEDPQRLVDARAALERASADYRRALELAPHEASTVGSRAEVLVRLSDVTDDDSFAQEALRLLEREVRYAPRNGRLHAFWGLQLALHGDHAVAVHELDEVVARFPDDIAALRYAADGYREAGESAKAARTQTRLERLTDDD